MGLNGGLDAPESDRAGENLKVSIRSHPIDVSSAMNVEWAAIVDRLGRANGRFSTPFVAPPNDIEGLIQGLAARDQRAFAAFYDRTVAFVFGLLLRILGDRNTAEEVAQDVYLQLWRTAGTFDSRRSSGLAWIATVARSRAIDRLRADASLKNALHGLAHEPNPKESASPEEEASLRERRTRVLEALLALPPEQRSAIELAFFEGLSHSEIARKTDTPLGTVKTRIRAAIGKLEQALQALR
jgi:RNA polymerase sigma-70 factor, ECF subfamily